MVMFPLFGSAVALAGGDKLAGERGYNTLFKHLGWSQKEMRLVAAAEFAGGLLMIPRATRPIGGAMVAAASGAVFASEVRHGDSNLAASRGVVLAIALLAWLGPRRAR